MKNSKKIQRGKAGFRQLLVTAFSIGIVLLAIVTTVVTTSLTSGSVEQRLAQEGLSLTETLAERSRVALLYQSESEAKYIVEAILAFPDMLGVAIYDEERTPVYISSAEVFERSAGRLWPTDLQLDSESEDAWHFVAPVFTGTQSDDEALFLTEEVEPELIGYVRVLMGKETLRRMGTDIFQYNLLVSFALAAILLVILLAITSQLTRPLSKLAGVMARAREGEKDVRADVAGTREVVEMEVAFNTMMDVLDAREEDLRATRDLALEAARVKGEFAANVSHELRTPLNGVLGMLDLLTDTGLSSKQQEYLEIAAGSADSLLALIDDILDFSKLDSANQALDQTLFSLADMLEDIIVLLCTQAQRKDLDIAYLMDAAVPDVLSGDSGRIRQVLLNLVGNALKFTHQGEVCIEVTLIETSAQGVALHFEVRDTGIGMSEKTQSKIFDAFSQADGSTTRKYGGTGLGLAISRQLVNLMGGELKVISEEGRGSTFWFDLQFAVDETSSQGSEQEPFNVTDIKVLVADDSQLARRYMSQLLSRVQVEHELAVNGVEALEKLRSASQAGTPYQAILIEGSMQGMRGSDLARLILNDPAITHTSIFMMQNRASSTVEDTEQLTIAGFVPKPAQRKDLLAILSESFGVPDNRFLSDQRVVPTRANQLSTFDGKRILIVEDNRANQQVAEGMLNRLDCKSVIANNGKESLELITREHFDLVLMDCHMPEMDGYEATAQIRKFEAGAQRIPIVAMTANVQQGEAEKCLAVGMDDYLAKPIKLAALSATLTQWLDAVRSNEVNPGGDGSRAVLAGNTSGVIDAVVMAELRDQIGDALPAMVRTFIDDMPGYIRSLQDAISVADSKAIADMAHGIKGGASNLGAHRLTAVCQALEDKRRADDASGTDELMLQLIAESELLLECLNNEYPDDTVSAREPDSVAGFMQSMAGSASSTEQLRVLIVDDDRAMRFAMRTVLEKDNYRVDEVTSGEQALLYCERFMPDLILMDAIMPGMDGFKACSEVQRMPGGKHVPVLIITALNDEMSIGRAFSAGATDYIAKPVNFSVLRKRIARLLQTSLAEKYVREMAYHDTLTGLPNRTMFTETLGDMMTANNGKNMIAVLFLDLDRFKLVNDTFGHHAGDLLLKVVAERLQGSVRQGDMVSRFGGDEFTIVLSRIKTYEVVEQVATKIQQTLSRPFVFLGKEMHVSTSIGIAMYPDDGDDIGTLLKNADIAMYRAKEQGNRYDFYESKMEVDVARRLRMENDLRGAVQRNEMIVFYQPQEDLKTGELIGMEALVRWLHPVRGMVNPFEFIELAEETGQIFELGEWVMRTACKQLKSWLNEGCKPVRIAVNLSGRQLENDNVVERIANVLAETGLAAHLLELEITEGTIMRNAEKVIVTLEKLKAMGVMLAIDDFGTGYSSLSYLKRFPIDLLKIDRAFVADLDTDNIDADIVTTIITLAHSLGVKVIAEGVETEEQKTFLAREGCDYMQGYLLGKPVPAEEFESTFLRDSELIV